MNNWWDSQIKRAAQLSHLKGSKDLLDFYEHLLRSQKLIYEQLRSGKTSGDLERDLGVLTDCLRPLLQTVATHGPESLAEDSQYIMESSPDVLRQLLFEYWSTPTDIQFFGKACLQPYFKCLAETATKPVGRESIPDERHCGFCGGSPQVSFLKNKETTAESGNRDLICGTCLTSWEFRRVVCANCGEERPTKIGYFHSSEFDHIRIEACDTCKHYLKGVDLTRMGFAMPLVDDIASAPLDLWAREQGYLKIELNLVGL